MKRIAGGKTHQSQAMTLFEEYTLLFRVTRAGHTTEYYCVILQQMRRRLADKTGVGTVVDVRASSSRDAAGRAVLRDQMQRITPQERGIAVVLKDSPTAAVMRLISQSLAGPLTDLNATFHDSFESALEWTTGIGEAA